MMNISPIKNIHHPPLVVYTEAVPDPPLPAGPLPSAGFWPPNHVMGLSDPIKDAGAAAAFDDAAAAGTPSVEPLLVAVGASPAGGVAVAWPTMAWRGTMLGYYGM